MIHRRSSIIGMFALLLVVALFAAFYLNDSGESPNDRPISVTQFVSSALGPTSSQRREYSCVDFPQEESSRMVQQFVAYLQQHGKSELECSFSCAVNLGMDTSNTSNVVVRTKANLPVKLSLAALEDGTTLLQDATGHVLATSHTDADLSIITDATLDRLHEAWDDCRSIDHKEQTLDGE